MAVMKEFWRGKKVLVTGHTGFKGSWLTLWLTNMGAKVTGIALEPAVKPSLFEELRLKEKLEGHYNEDIRNAERIYELVAMSKPEFVFHLAAQALVMEGYRDPLNTWSTNVQGSLNVLESLRSLNNQCVVIMVTTDKVYANREWDYGYRENDRLGGHDPYSASKAAAELAIGSWRSSYCGEAKDQLDNLAIATVRAGNVIGGGDWAENRIIPDAIKALKAERPVVIRNPNAKRPWQHVLEPLSGYLCLAQKLSNGYSEKEELKKLCTAYNFGPRNESNRTVEDLIRESLKSWKGQWIDHSKKDGPHEAVKLQLQIEKASELLKWRPCWSFERTVSQTILWYKAVHNGEDTEHCCMNDITCYERDIEKRIAE